MLRAGTSGRQPRQGSGDSCRVGAARGTYTIIQDADLEYDPRDYPRLIEPLVAGEADVVYGSRYLRPAIQERRRWYADTACRRSTGWFGCCMAYG